MLYSWTWPRMGWAKTMLAAALPTNQSPATTSIGEPFREYGCTVAAMIGNLENITKPAPSAPLERNVVANVGKMFDSRAYGGTIPVEKFGIW